MYRTGGRDSRPRPIVGEARQSRLDRVLEHVFEDVGVLVVALERPRIEAAAEDVMAEAVTFVEAARIGAVQVSHAVGQVRFGRLDDEVVVRAEEAVGVQAPAVPARHPLQEVEEETAIVVAEEDEGAPVADGGDVVVRTGLELSERAAHVSTVAAGAAWL
jgi:hypothetical protein